MIYYEGIHVSEGIDVNRKWIKRVYYLLLLALFR